MKYSAWFYLGCFACSTVAAAPHGPTDHPGGGHPDQPLPGWQQPTPHHPAPQPGVMVELLPPGYKTVLFAGLTYFVFNEIWYQLHGGRYEVVTPPNQEAPTVNPYYENGMTRVDIDGIRYYVREGRYYRRNANGEYREVTPP